MDKKYTLKVKSSTEVAASAPHVDILPEKEDASGGGLGSFLKFLVVVAVIAIIAVPVGKKLKVSHDYKIGDELLRRAQNTDVFYDMTYYEADNCFKIDFLLTDAQIATLNLSEGWPDFTLAILEFSRDSYDYIVDKNSSAWCYVEVYDEELNSLMFIRNGTLTSYNVK